MTSPEKIDESSFNKKIEAEFEELARQINNEKEIKKFNKLFTNYEIGIKNFKENKELFEINEKDEKWKNKLEKDITDDRTCFGVMIPYIGNKRASPNYLKIVDYFANKINKKDEMSEIYQYIYYCFFGRRNPEDKKSPVERFNPNYKNIRQLLVNIIKFTFYYDRNRKERIYYFLAIFQELLTQKDEQIKKTIFQLKNKTLYQLVLMSIDLINDKNGFYRNGYIDCPKQNHI